jgi:abequosyltransferase
MAPRLSICIPTYNFGQFIGETLESIVNQAPDVEIVIVDGASTDNTRSVISQWQTKFSNIKYVLLEQRGGIDRDLATAVEQASGQYCWLFSSDDVMRPYAIKSLLGRLKDACDVYICSHTICDKHMRVMYPYQIFSDGLGRTIEFSNSDQRRKCMAAGKNTEVLFSFMSGLIVNREKWLSIEPDTIFLGSCWWHVARLLELARKQLKVCYVAEAWLDKRGDNDSFMESGVVNRFRIAVDGFVGLATHFYGAQSVEAESVLRFLRSELSLLSFFYARDRILLSRDLNELPELNRIFDVCYSKKFLMRALYHHLPVPVYQRMKSTYKFLRGRWRLITGMTRKRTYT